MSDQALWVITNAVMLFAEKELHSMGEISDDQYTAGVYEVLGNCDWWLVHYGNQTEPQTHMDNVLTYIADKFQTTKEELLDGLIKDEPQDWKDEMWAEAVREEGEEI